MNSMSHLFYQSDWLVICKTGFAQLKISGELGNYECSGFGKLAEIELAESNPDSSQRWCNLNWKADEQLAKGGLPKSWIIFPWAAVLVARVVIAQTC